MTQADRELNLSVIYNDMMNLKAGVRFIRSTSQHVDASIPFTKRTQSHQETMNRLALAEDALHDAIRALERLKL